MMNDLDHCLKTMGLNLSTDKTSINTNNRAWRNHTITTTTGTIKINVPGTPLTILGTLLDLDGQLTHELKHRRTKALNVYWAQKEALTNKTTSLKRRIQLLQATITTTPLGGRKLDHYSPAKGFIGCFPPLDD